MHITLIFLINILHRLLRHAPSFPSLSLFLFLSLRLIPPLILTSKRSTFPPPPSPSTNTYVCTPFQHNYIPSQGTRTTCVLNVPSKPFSFLFKVRTTTSWNLGTLNPSNNVTSRLDNREGCSCYREHNKSRHMVP